MSSALELVTTLRDLTQRQVDAALALDGPTLADLNGQRSQILFDLQVALKAPVSSDEKVAMRPIIEELNLLEHRLRAAASQVVQTIDVFAPSKRATTYGRSGRVR